MPSEESGLVASSRTEWSETQDSKEWDDFVTQNGGSFFHLWSWRKVLEHGDSRPLYLICRDRGGRILAACPFFLEVGRRGRHISQMQLASLPDCPTAGPLVSPLAKDPAQLISSLRKSRRSSLLHPVTAMVIKTHQQPIIDLLKALGDTYDSASDLFILDLHEKPPEHVWHKGFQKHDREAVKYYEEKGTEFGFARSEGDYSDYLALERGSVLHQDERADFLQRLRSNLGSRLGVALVRFGDKTIAGNTMLFDSLNSIIHLGIIRFSSIRNIHSSVTYINWKTISWANEHGFRYVNFGAYPADKSSNPAHPFFRLKDRFEITLVPRYRFTLSIPNVPYAIARRINRVV